MRGKNIHFSTNEREPPHKSSRSHLGLSKEDYFSTPKVVYQDKVMQPYAPNLGAKSSNDLFPESRNPTMIDHSPERIRPRHLEPKIFYDGKTSSSKFTIPDSDENENLKMHLVEQENIDRKF